MIIQPEIYYRFQFYFSITKEENEIFYTFYHDKEGRTQASDRHFLGLALDEFNWKYNKITHLEDATSGFDGDEQICIEVSTEVLPDQRFTKQLISRLQVHLEKFLQDHRKGKYPQFS